MDDQHSFLPYVRTSIRAGLQPLSANFKGTRGFVIKMNLDGVAKLRAPDFEGGKYTRLYAFRLPKLLMFRSG